MNGKSASDTEITIVMPDRNLATEAVYNDQTLNATISVVNGTINNSNVTTGNYEIGSQVTLSANAENITGNFVSGGFAG